MFENYLIKHEKFTPDIDYPIAQRLDYKPQTTHMDSYAEALKRDTEPMNTSPNSKASKRFNKPPKAYCARQLDFDIESQEFPALQATSQNMNSTQNEASLNSSTQQAHTPTQIPTPTSTTIDIAALQQTILQNIQSELTQHIKKQVQQEMTAFKTDMLSITNDLSKKQDHTNNTMAQMQAQLATLINIMSPQTNGGGMK